MTFVAGTGFTLFGYDQGVMSGLLTLEAFEQQFPQTAGGFEGSNSATLQSLLVAICTLISGAWDAKLTDRRAGMYGGRTVQLVCRRQARSQAHHHPVSQTQGGLPSRLTSEVAA